MQRNGFVTLSLAAYRDMTPPKAGRDWEAELAADCATANLPMPQREYLFAPPRRWRFDFAWPDRYLAVEVEGATWANGRHTSGAGFARDCEKYNHAALLGWCVLRVTGDMVRDGRAVTLIAQALGSRPIWLPEPSPKGAA